jgi:hypothetical protein
MGRVAGGAVNAGLRRAGRGRTLAGDGSMYRRVASARPGIRSREGSRLAAVAAPEFSAFFA